ncbi:unnamed protein product [Rotaria sp. Silwood1]|nr:unnamed protein product [Rotaria sp. Silwood1]
MVCCSVISWLHFNTNPGRKIPDSDPVGSDEVLGGALELELAFINTNANALGISIKINPNGLALLALVLINS